MFNRDNLPNIPNPFNRNSPQPTAQGYGQTPPRTQQDPYSRGSGYGAAQQYGGGQQGYGSAGGRGGYQAQASTRGAAQTQQFGITKVPDETWVLQNVMAVSPEDFREETYAILDERCVVTVRYGGGTHEK